MTLTLLEGLAYGVLVLGYGGILIFMLFSAAMHIYNFVKTGKM